MKTSKILSAFAILALVSVGCHHDDNPSVKKAEISANVSGQAGTQAFTWTEGSTIALVNESKTVKYEIKSGVGSVSAKFEGEEFNGVAKFASSPYTGGSTTDGETFNFEFPSVQYVAGAINSTDFVTPNDVKVLVAGRTANGQTFDFENVAAFIRIPVVSKENCSIDSVQVEACGEAKVSGKSVVVWEDGTPSVTIDPSSGLKSSKVVFGSPFFASSEPVYVTVPIAPGDYSNGLRITVFTKIANSKTSYDYGVIEAGEVYETEEITCGNSFAILIDGPSFNTKIKEYVASITGEPAAQLDTNEREIKRIIFNVNSEMPSDPECIDLSQRQDRTILADYDVEEKFLNVYTGAASIAVVSGSNMFHGFKNIESVEGLEYLDTYGATAMKHMFSQSSFTNLDLSSFHNVNATGVDSMFWRCVDLESLVLSDDFITSKVLRAAALFHSCASLKRVDVSKFDLTNCASISQMYQYCYAMDTIVCNLDASACTTISQMFYDCRNTKHIDISGLKTSDMLISTRYMFYRCNSLEGTLDFSNFYTLSDTCFFRAFNGMGKVDTIKIGEDMKLDAALKRSESRNTPLQYFFGSTSTPSSVDCYVGAGHTPDNPTVVICSRLFLQQLIKVSTPNSNGARIQLKSRQVKFVNYSGNQFLIKDKNGKDVDFKDINTSTTTYVVVDPDDPTK